MIPRAGDYEVNEHPCGQCARFAPAEPLPKPNKVLALFGIRPVIRAEHLSRCRRFGMPVGDTYHMVHLVGAPCFEEIENVA